MHQGITHKEAVRLAKEALGNATAQEMAAYIQEHFGLTIQPPIVTVLLGTFLERASLDRSAQEARERIERWKAENPEEAKKLIASAKRREVARRKKAAGVQVAESPGAALPRELQSDQSVEVPVGSSPGGVRGDLPGLSLPVEGASPCDGGDAAP